MSRLGEIRVGDIRIGDSRAHNSSAPAQRTAADTRVNPMSITALSAAIARNAKPFTDIASAPLDNLLARIGEAQLVLINGANTGAVEIQAMRNRITTALITEKGFNVVALTADAADAARLDHDVRLASYSASGLTAFTPFGAQTWRTPEMRAFVEDLRSINDKRKLSDRVRIHGLDHANTHRALDAIIMYLNGVDPASAKRARARYTHFLSAPGSTDDNVPLALRDRIHETAARGILQNLQDQWRRAADHDSDRITDAQLRVKHRNDLPQQIRTAYLGLPESKALRDAQMFETLQAVLRFHGPGAKVVVWAENTDASAGSFNQLCRTSFDDTATMISFGTYTGTIAAADSWGADVKAVALPPVQAQSLEAACHTTNLSNFILSVREAPHNLRQYLDQSRAQQPFGLILANDPDADDQDAAQANIASARSAPLAAFCDEYIWLDEINATDILSALAFNDASDIDEG
jgi:protein-L-isoaspartate(D-aspartate) O-methyltransferase